MEISYLITLAAFILTFSIGFTWLNHFAKHISDFEPSSKLKQDTYLPIYFISFTASLALFFTNQNTYDFIYKPQYYSLVAAILCAGIIYLVSLFNKTSKLTPVIILASAVGCSFLIPNGFLLFEGNIPAILDRIIIIAIWSAFSFCYKYLNGIDGILSTQNLTIGLGILLISLLGGAPALVGNYAIILIAITAAFMIFNWYPARIILKPGACNAWGFIVAWLILQASQEGSGSCCLIFCLFFIIEVVWAVALKLSWRPQYKNIVANTNYYQANVSGLAPNFICNAVLKLQTILLIFGTFQIYAPNSISLPALCLIMSVWFISKIKNWQEERQSFKEINHSFIQEVKENVDDLKKHLKKDK